MSFTLILCFLLLLVLAGVAVLFSMKKKNDRA